MTHNLFLVGRRMKGMTNNSALVSRRMKGVTHNLVLVGLLLGKVLEDEEDGMNLTLPSYKIKQSYYDGCYAGGA